MCGIAGVFGSGDDVAVCRMLPALRHRGPDDEYHIKGDGFVLGARRLSIIDLAGGRQPIADESKKIWVAQNGEIYNFPVLMDRLKAAGHRFRSRADTEVLVHLYEEKGSEFVHELNGMFAIALWDGTHKQGILARDRVGKKPLYFYVTDRGVLYFASEIKALLTLPFVRRQINPVALHHYLSYKHVPAPLSIFSGIHMLAPGHLLLYRIDEHGHSSYSIKRYWRADFSHVWSAGLAEDEIIERILQSLLKSVERRLISDVPVGFFLSGGVDSSLCTALAATLASAPVETFTLAYGPESTTRAKEHDRRCAAIVAQRYGTKHHEEVIEAANLEEDLHAIVGQFDEPFAGVISAYFLARRIAQHVKVAVAGDGADELFGSYLSHRVAAPIQAFLNNPASLDNGDHAAHLSSSDRDVVREIACQQDWRWRYRLGVFSEEEKRALYAPELRDELADVSTVDHMKSYFDALTAVDPLNRILEAEFNSQLPDQVLTYADRLSMAHSLEVRSPFLDKEFVELAVGIDGGWKIRGGEVKYILKKAALRYLPEEVVFRPKEGFVMPINQWLAGRLEPYIRTLLSSRRVRRHGLFNDDFVERLVNGFYQGSARDAVKVWTLAMFQLWYERYIDAPVAQ